MEEGNNAFEFVKVAAAIATPLAVAVIGFVLVRRVEGIKALVAHRSDFQRQWADEFFKCGQEFMQTLERELALLTFIAGLEDPNGKLGTEMQLEVSRLLPKLSECELRVRRSVVFAPVNGPRVVRGSQSCIALTSELLKQRKGSVDEIIARMNEFNAASRDAHAEMLGLIRPFTN